MEYFILAQPYKLNPDVESFFFTNPVIGLEMVLIHILFLLFFLFVVLLSNQLWHLNL